MKRLLTFVELSSISLLLVLLLSQPVMAYVGPGAAIAAIGAFLALIVGVLAALLGFLWYPVKRLLWKRKKSRENDNSTREAE